MIASMPLTMAIRCESANRLTPRRILIRLAT
jgi:hypothetical protein